jgi:hypothetical protein
VICDIPREFALQKGWACLTIWEVEEKSNTSHYFILLSMDLFDLISSSVPENRLKFPFPSKKSSPVTTKGNNHHFRKTIKNPIAKYIIHFLAPFLQPIFQKGAPQYGKGHKTTPWHGLFAVSKITKLYQNATFCKNTVLRKSWGTMIKLPIHPHFIQKE